nr:hypothetical protein [uncultured Psychroserpens sp.]
MKQLLFILTISAALAVNAQEVKQVDMCLSGTEQAINNFNLGIYNIYSFGWAGQPTGGFEAYYNKHLFEKFGIKMVSMGCVVMPSDECYNKKMQELLYDRFGDNLFEKTREEAQEAFDKIKN